MAATYSNKKLDRASDKNGELFRFQETITFTGVTSADFTPELNDAIDWGTETISGTGVSAYSKSGKTITFTATASDVIRCFAYGHQ